MFWRCVSCGRLLSCSCVPSCALAFESCCRGVRLCRSCVSVLLAARRSRRLARQAREANVLTYLGNPLGNFAPQTPALLQSQTERR